MGLKLITHTHTILRLQGEFPCRLDGISFYWDGPQLVFVNGDALRSAFSLLVALHVVSIQ